MCAGTGTGPEARRSWVTEGSAGHCPACTWCRVALVPEFSVSQPSPAQVTVEIVCTTRLPTDPAPASRHSAGVADADTSLQRSPGMPTSTTGWALAEEFKDCTV